MQAVLGGMVTLTDFGMNFNGAGIILAILTILVVVLHGTGIIDSTGVLHGLLVIIIFALIYIGTNTFGILNEIRLRNES
jgi:hypothetical protein